MDVSAERNALVIRPVRHNPRQGWAEALAAVPERDQAELTFRETPHDWDSRSGSGSAPVRDLGGVDGPGRRIGNAEALTGGRIVSPVRKRR